MLELANMFGLRYFMLKEESPTRHIILVKNEYGKQATFWMETTILIKGDLPIKDEEEAKKFIRDFRDEFLDIMKDAKG